MTSFSVIINGSLESFFNSSRGLGQGDPLSLNLFVTSMEVFSILIEKVVNGGYSLRGRHGATFRFSHLIFIDDNLVMCKESVEEMTHFSWLHLCFEAISRLKVNLEKTVSYPMGNVENSNL